MGFLPVFSLISLICGLVLLGPAIATIVKIYNGSQLPFSYALMIFSLGYCFSFFESWSTYTYGKNIVKIHTASNTIYFMLSL